MSPRAASSTTASSAHRSRRRHGRRCTQGPEHRPRLDIESFLLYNREMLPNDHRSRMERARLALCGLSVGDAFGERFFVNPDIVETLVSSRAVRKDPWSWTDD